MGDDSIKDEDEHIDSVSERFRYLLEMLKEDYIKEDVDEVVVSTVLMYDGILGCSYFMSREELHQIVDEILSAVNETDETAEAVEMLKNSTLH